MTQGTLQERFNGQMGQLLGPAFPTDLALAVSGGGDSMAMLTLAHHWARVFGVRLWVVTVDHGLRPESAREAQMVAAECAALGWPHATLRWRWSGKGNLQDAARTARLSLINRWRGGLQHVAMAHTLDDVAETFLLRLKRGSGVEGLSAMAAKRQVQMVSQPLDPAQIDQTLAPPPAASFDTGFTLIRPLLQESRAALRFYIETLKVPYVNDPSNADDRFDRVKMRALLSQMQAAGITAETLSATAHRLRDTRVAAHHRARDAAQGVVQRDSVLGTVRMDRDGFAQLERDTQRRLLADALQWISSHTYRPRLRKLDALLERILAGGSGTLLGCEVQCAGSHLTLFREFQAVADTKTCVDGPTTWDHRWQLNVPKFNGLQLRALGDDGWAQIADLGQPSTPHRIARSLPALYDDARLVACPAVTGTGGENITLKPIYQSLLDPPHQA